MLTRLWLTVKCTTRVSPGSEFVAGFLGRSQEHRVNIRLLLEFPQVFLTARARRKVDGTCVIKN